MARISSLSVPALLVLLIGIAASVLVILLLGLFDSMGASAPY